MNVLPAKTEPARSHFGQERGQRRGHRHLQSRQLGASLPRRVCTAACAHRLTHTRSPSWERVTFAVLGRHPGVFGIHPGCSRHVQAGSWRHCPVKSGRSRLVRRGLAVYTSETRPRRLVMMRRLLGAEPQASDRGFTTKTLGWGCSPCSDFSGTPSLGCSERL